MLQDLVRATATGAPFDATSVPERVVLAADRMRLRLIWSEREAADMSARRLRAACRCAWCTRARIEGAFAEPSAAVAIDRVTPVGDYAVNIAFDDGHARGIYPWVYLRELARDDGSIA
jgi:DUF971 family protein